MITTLIGFFIRTLNLLHVGEFKTQIQSCIVLSLPVSAIPVLTDTLHQWKENNLIYVLGVLACIAFDHALGSYVHWKIKRDFSLKENAKGLILKISLCGISIVMFDIIGSIVKEVSLVYDYLNIVTKLVVILYPAGSAFMNMSEISNGKFPPKAWLRKIKNFNTNLDLSNFKEKENEVH